MRQASRKPRFFKRVSLTSLTHGTFEKAHMLLSGAKWLGYNLNGKLCWVTEGNVQGEDKAECCRFLVMSEMKTTNASISPRIAAM